MTTQEKMALMSMRLAFKVTLGRYLKLLGPDAASEIVGLEADIIKGLKDTRISPEPSHEDFIIAVDVGITQVRQAVEDVRWTIGVA